MATFDVLLPVKDGIAFLAEALESIVAQTYRDWRLIVLDHGSTDGSAELAADYAMRDARIIVRAFPAARGLSGLLNCGLDLCDCKYVLRQDADDVSLPERMAVLARAFEADPALVVVGSLGDVIDAGGKTIGQIDMPTGPHGVIASALFRTPVCHPAAALRLDALQRLGQASGLAVRYGDDFIGALAPARRLQVPALAEDYFLFGQLALLAPCVNLSRKLIQYRWHGANVGATRHHAQMQVALDISRSLAESAAIVHGAAYADPAPFCNHGERLFEIEGQSDFSASYQALATLLQQLAPAGLELERELAFRRVLARRDRATMASRFGVFAARYGVRPAEQRTVRSWLLRGWQKQALLRLTPNGLAQ
ncbi:glycosyltransferase family 2 protein [Massilia sp. PWRC2]|uniref:glycosyltransferase family 2 protein n=1 Tax=Massilia sp. PWRC2 TaxID=2804626 RepID=UPI003CF3857E